MFTLSLYRETITQEMINGRMVTVTHRSNDPSPEAIQRYADTMVRIVQQAEERERAGNLKPQV
jgi:hypothetical protein